MNVHSAPRACPEITGHRILLQPVRASDASHFLAMWQDEGFARDAGIEATSDLQGLTRALERFAQLNASGLFFKWCIRLRENHGFAGEIEAYPLKLQTSPWLEWGIGYSLARNYWGQGLMREAIENVLDYLFNEGLAQRIRADVGNDNERSQHLLKRIGFRLEGMQEAKNLIHGQPVDMQLWAISRLRYLGWKNEASKVVTSPPANAHQCVPGTLPSTPFT